jgi:hypothetical protein
MKAICSVILSVVILTTSIGFSVSSPIFCGKKAKTVLSIGHIAISYSSEKSQHDCASKEHLKSNCFQDEVQGIQLEVDGVPKIRMFYFFRHFLIAFLSSYVALFDAKTPEIFFFTAHSSPLLNHDIPLFIQSFLI